MTIQCRCLFQFVAATAAAANLLFINLNHRDEVTFVCSRRCSFDSAAAIETDYSNRRLLGIQGPSYHKCSLMISKTLYEKLSLHSEWGGLL